MIPTFNQPQYIEQAVKSALSQKYEYLEVIVSDDSTNDETYQKIQPFLIDNRFRYYRNQNKLGRVGNYRELLYKLAKGDWVVMLDGDDYYIDENFISKAIELINTDSEIVLAGAGIKIYHEFTNTFSSQVLPTDNIVFSGKDFFSKYQQLPNHQTDVYKRKLACKLDFYRDSSTASDSESLYRLCLHGKVAYLPNEVAVWRVHNSNATYNRDLKKQIKEIVFIDSVYKYALKYLDTSIAKRWRMNMYKSMSTHLLNLSFDANCYTCILKILVRFWFFLGTKTTIIYFRKLLSLYIKHLTNKSIIVLN